MSSELTFESSGRLPNVEIGLDRSKLFGVGAGMTQYRGSKRPGSLGSLVAWSWRLQVECGLGDRNSEYGLRQTSDWVWNEGPKDAGIGAGDVGDFSLCCGLQLWASGLC
jgi:hypothetical protein